MSETVEEQEVEQEPEEVEEKPKSPPKRSATIAVQKMSEAGKTATVQWLDEEGEYHKSEILADAIDEGMVKASVLKAGEDPFRWEDEGLDPIWARGLRRAGIYTIDDYMARASNALDTLRGIANRVMREIIRRRKSQRS